MYGESQSPERISERGGFGVKESFELKWGEITEIEVWFSHSVSYPKNDSKWGKIKFMVNKEENTISYKILENEQY